MSPEYWNRVRAHYEAARDEMESTPKNRWALDPYAWEHDAGIWMSPIERSLWCDIRRGGIVMYPQYPVDRYFVDFGNPKAKVAIECDGAAFHTDKAKDMRRQLAIERAGWVVYRISGRDCHRDDEEEEDEYGRPVIHRSPGMNLVVYLGQNHGIKL